MQPFGLIYVITNHVNGKKYVGQTTQCLGQRWAQHKSASKQEATYQSAIYKAMRKYGSDKFSIEEFAVAFDRPGLDAAEDLCIEQLQTLVPNGYNLCVGNGGHNHIEATKERLRAYRHTDEIKRQMSERQKRRYEDPAEQAKQGRKQSDAEKAKRSATMKRIGHRPTNTPESIAKMIASKTGVPSGRNKQVIDQHGTIYQSLGEAATAIGVSISYISKHVSGGTQSVRGYVLQLITRQHKISA